MRPSVRASFLMFFHMTMWTYAVYSQEDDCPFKECRFIPKIISPRPMLAMNGRQLPFTGISLFLDSGPADGCYVNTTRFIDSYNLTGIDAMVSIGFHCSHSFNVYLTSYDRERMDNVIAYIQIQDCIIGFNEINKLGSLIIPYSLTIRDGLMPADDGFCNDHQPIQPTDCSRFQSLSTIWFDTTSGEGPIFNMSAILQCNFTFSDIGELFVSYFDEKDFPAVQDKFPRLQTLELPNSGFKVPPRFPWWNELLPFPLNTSCLPYIEDQYTAMFHLTVDAHVHRRLYNLNSNNITDLTNFEFDGLLHMLQLSKNGLQYFSNKTFSKIKGLQHLDLSNNRISSLPSGCFTSLVDLKHLDLHSNRLTEMPDDTFAMNTKIIYLNIANNSLRVIGKTAFDKLGMLKELHLEFNNIISIPESSFPSYNQEFQFLHLKHNPIRDIPVSVFYFRNLVHTDFSETSIDFSNFTDWLDKLEFTKLAESIVKSLTTDVDLFQTPEKLRTLDLTGSRVENIHFYNFFETSPSVKNNRTIRQTRLLMVLKNFKFILDKNPITCNCRINELNKFIQIQITRNLLDGNEYFFKEWKCQFPLEFRGRPMINVKESETYCEINIHNCPANCTCNKRSVSGIIIVDCRGRGLLEFPQNAPNGSLDIWFQGNNISELAYRDYLPRVRHLHLSNNSISKISLSSLSAMRRVNELHLDSNYLVGLPVEIKKLSLKLLVLKNNPFKCDCHTLWMKSWIHRNQRVINDTMDITCNVDDKDEEGKLFINVPDAEFVCLEDFDSMKHVVAPSVACSLALALFITLICLVYIYRMEVKVLLYIYFGIHPFDRDDKESKEEIDLLVVHSPLLTEWVMENIVDFLNTNHNNYVVSEMMRDFVAGFSYQENIASMVKHSKRMLILLSPDLADDNDLLKVAWNEAQEKIKEKRTNYAIIVCYMVTLKQISNKDLQRYVKRGRYIDTKHRLFSKKILYLMPQCKSPKDKVKILPDLKMKMNSTYGEYTEIDDGFERHAFIAYSDIDIGYTMNELRPKLEERGFSLCLPDRDFIPGASKEENILKAVENCLHTIFVLSGDHLQDEWALFTFRSASEKSLRFKCNHLIVIILDDTEMDSMDEEVCYYVKTHVTLYANDRWFMDRLVKALPRVNDNKPCARNGDTNFVQFKNNACTNTQTYERKLDDNKMLDFVNQPDILFLPENGDIKSDGEDTLLYLQHRDQNGGTFVYDNEIFDPDDDKE